MNQADRRLSQAALVIANLIPLLGVVAWGWSAFDVVFLYWFENVVIGVMTVVKMLTCMPDADEVEASIRSRLNKQWKGAPLTSEQRDSLQQMRQQLGKHGTFGAHAIKLFLIPFFCVHYGLFCMVHGVFVFVLLGGAANFAGPPALAGAAAGVLTNTWMLLSVVALAASHVVSYFVNFLWGGEYRRTIPPMLMAEPYPRIVVLHIAILGGGFAAAALGSPIWALVILIAGKTMLDLKLHNWQHSTVDNGNAVLTTVPDGT